jgi:hypothetical protein
MMCDLPECKDELERYVIDRRVPKPVLGQRAVDIHVQFYIAEAIVEAD